MKLLRSTKKDVCKDKDGENVPKLESVEVALVHCYVVKNDYQHTSKVFLLFQIENSDVNKHFTPFFKDNEHS